MAHRDPTAEELGCEYQDAVRKVKDPPGDLLDPEERASKAVRAVLARYRCDDPDDALVKTLARSFTCRNRLPPGPALMVVIKKIRGARGPLAKPVGLAKELLAACAADLERVGRPWSPAFRDAVLRIANKRLPRRNLRRDARAAAALLEALRNVDDVAKSGFDGNPNFRWWVERVVRPLLCDEGAVLERYARSDSEPMTVLRQLVTVYDSKDFLGLGRKATNRELAVFCILCGAVVLRGSSRREPSLGDVLRYAQSTIIKARRQTGIEALERSPESLEYPTPLNRRQVHALAVEELRRAGFVPPAPTARGLPSSKADRGNGDSPIFPRGLPID